MNATQRAGLLQRWKVVQEELIPELGAELEGLTPKLEKVIHTLEWVRIEAFVPRGCGVGRPPHDRGAMANALVAGGAGIVDDERTDRTAGGGSGVAAPVWICALEEAAGRSHVLPRLR